MQAVSWSTRPARSAAPITLGAAQTWTTAIGQTLTVSGAVNNGGNLLTLASADATGATTISGAISGGGGLTSRGAGLATLSGLNTYTGPTNVTAGTLDIAAGGAVSGTSLVNPTGGSVLTIEGSVSMAPNGTFAVGSANGNSGTINVNPGAVVNIGNGSGGTVGGTYIGGYINASGSGPGVGTLNINGGILNVAAAGTVNGGDGSHLWLNPWGGSGSTINLNGGTLSTARPISNGTGSSAAYFYFNGGTLQADASINILDNSALTTYVEAAGATIDTNGYNATIYPALLSGVANDGGVTKIGAGSLTLAGNNTYTGPTTITAGTLVLTGGNTTYLGGNLNINNGSTLTLTGGEQYWFYSKSFIFDANGGGTINATGAKRLCCRLRQRYIYDGELAPLGHPRVEKLADLGVPVCVRVGGHHGCPERHALESVDSRRDIHGDDGLFDSLISSMTTASVPRILRETRSSNTSLTK